jgi:hypothetical protein
MFGALTAFDALFRQSSPDSAVAAAVTVLSINPPRERLGPALLAVAPHLTGARRAGQMRRRWFRASSILSKPTPIIPIPFLNHRRPAPKIAPAR